MNTPFYDWFGHSVEEVFPTSAKLAEALEKCSQSGIEGGRAEDSAFSLAIGGGESVFEFFEKRPDKQRRLRGAMEAVGMDGGHDLGFVVGGFDWGKLGRGVVVDVSHSFFFLLLYFWTIINGWVLVGRRILWLPEHCSRERIRGPVLRGPGLQTYR